MSRVLKLLVAVAVAFAPNLMSAFASSGQGRVNAQVLSLEEMQSEFGAGGGGGGGTPTPPRIPAPNNCTWDRDADYKCDTIRYSAILDNVSESKEFITASDWITCNQSSLVEGQNYCSGSIPYTHSNVSLTTTFNGQFTNALSAGIELTYTRPSFTSSPNYTIALGFRVRLEVYNMYYNKSGHENRVYSDVDGITSTDYRVGSWSAKQYFARSASNVIGRPI